MSAEDLTLAEIQALPVGSVVQDEDGDRYVRADPPADRPAAVWYGTGLAFTGGPWPARHIIDFAPVSIVRTL